MKKIILTLAIFLIPAISFAYTSPGKPTGFVNDFANILTTDQKQGLDMKSAALKRDSGFEVVTVTVPDLGGDTVENYATKLFAEWGIGDAKKDTGLLILVSMKEHEIRIETGYGTEGIVTDLQSGNIIRNVITPAFKSGEYFTGLNGAFDAVSSIILKSPDAVQYSNKPNPTYNSFITTVPAPLKILYGIVFNPLFLWFIFIVVFNFGAKWLGKTKSWWLGGVIGAGAGVILGILTQSIIAGGFFVFLFTVLGLVFDYFVSNNKGGKGGPGGFFFGGFGGGSNFGGGGGFGGFGGGMSGGGGSSGRW